MTWLYVPSACVPATEDSTSESGSAPAERLARSATWRKKPHLQPFWQRVWRTVPWMKRLCGLTCAPSTLKRGVERWISSLRASRASHSASRAGNEAETTSGHSGPSCFASSANQEPKPSFSKRSQLSLLLDCPRSYKRWKPGGGAGRLSELRRRMQGLPTDALASSCSQWPTPTARDGLSGTGQSPKAQGGENLRTASRQWPTPSARDWKSGQASPETHAGNARPLNEAVVLLGAPTSPHPETQPSTTAESTPASGPTSPLRLRPNWDEWLMGLPHGWTDPTTPLGPTEFERWAMESYRWLSQLLGACSAGCSEGNA